MDVNTFISENKEKYETISFFQNLLNTITDKTFSTTIQYVEDRNNFFFKDRESSILFLSHIANFSVYNFQQFPLIQDVCIHFINPLKQTGIDELDLIDFNTDMLYSLNYLYNKSMISIDSIYRKSIYNITIFINFYPEIDEFDHEYAQIKRDEILNDEDHVFYSEKEFNFMNYVVKNLEEHKNNRKANFHQSPFHKSIRDDDIDTFQSILSKNNYSINHRFAKSYSERALTEDENPSLIQVAAVYGSLKIFKFLWMQPNIEITENLIDYAVSGRNFEIIHICETKCQLQRALMFSISSHQNELSEYIIENTQKPNENEAEKPNANENADESFENSNEDDNVYDVLSYSELKIALEFLNYDIIIPCLNKIVSIVRKYDNYDELEKVDQYGHNSFFSVQFFDLELFKFLYQNRNPKFSFFDGMNPVCFLWLMNRMIDVIKYIATFLNPEQLYQIFEDAIRINPKVTCFLMDLQLDELKNKEDHPIYDTFKQKIDELENDFFYYTIDYFDIEVMTKLFNLYYVIDDPEEFYDLVSNASPKMLNSFLRNKLTFSSKEKIDETADFFNDSGMNELAELILKYNK